MKATPLALILLLCCSANCSSTHETFVPSYTAGPPTLVYKTKADYSNNVPVMLSEDKTKIISFPDPKDVANNPVPVKLKDGYLLDNRGIGKNVAYLKMTYKEYGALAQPPSMDQMLSMIIDKDPLTELCDCGNKNAIPNPEKQMNKLIKKNQLRKICKVVK